MNILSIAQETAALVGCQVPTTLFNSSNSQSILFLSLMKDTLESLKRFGVWQETVRTASFYTLEGKTSYAFCEVVDDFFRLVPDTLVLKDEGKKLTGSLSISQVAEEEILSLAGHSFFIKEGAIHFITPPPVGSEIEFHYTSTHVVSEVQQTASGIQTIVEKPEPTKDTDTPLFDAYLVKLGLIWRWYKRNALAYQEELLEYEKELKKTFSMGKGVKNIHLASHLSALGGVHVKTIA